MVYFFNYLIISILVLLSKTSYYMTTSPELHYMNYMAIRKYLRDLKHGHTDVQTNGTHIHFYSMLESVKKQSPCLKTCKSFAALRRFKHFVKRSM